jgi:hypothetical protein
MSAVCVVSSQGGAGTSLRTIEKGSAASARVQLPSGMDAALPAALVSAMSKSNYFAACNADASGLALDEESTDAQEKPESSFGALIRFWTKVSLISHSR